ncbi:lytic transglycosylase domain-containing protein [Roseomonas mucosa]
MDLVKISAATGFAAMAIVAGAASGGGSQAQPLPAFSPADLDAARIQARIDDGFTASSRQQNFDTTGPLFPSGLDALAPPPANVAARPVAAGTVAGWAAYIDEASRRFGVPADWVRAVMLQESGGRTHLGGVPITSPAGAMGLMQVMPTTFAEMRTRYGLGADPYDPRTNILAGTAYLREMYDRYGSRHFLAAYNAGPGRVDAWLRGRSTLPAETRDYTTALLPRLGFSVPAAYTTTPGGVEDLTSREAISALLTAPSRAPAAHRVDAASSSVFAATSTRSATAGQHAASRRDEGLFVTLTATDRRREASADTPGQD